MLPSRYRLREKSDFARVLKNGKSRGSQFLAIRTLPRKNLSPVRSGVRFISNDCPVSRLGFVVGKKTFKKASQRNRIKRKLREATRPNLPLIKTGQDLIFIARGGLEKKNSKEIKEMILYLLKEANLLL